MKTSKICAGVLVAIFSVFAGGCSPEREEERTVSLEDQYVSPGDVSTEIPVDSVQMTLKATVYDGGVNVEYVDDGRVRNLRQCFETVFVAGHAVNGAAIRCLSEDGNTVGAYACGLFYTEALYRGEERISYTNSGYRCRQLLGPEPGRL